MRVPVRRFEYMEPGTLEQLSGIYGDEQVQAALQAWEDHREAHKADPNHDTVYFPLRGRFGGELPDDLGNVGYFYHYPSPLGSLSVYSEQFGGVDDIAAVLQLQEREFHRLFDVVLLWLEDYAGDAPEYPALRRVVDETLRRDAWSLTLMFSAANIVGPVVGDPYDNVEGDMLMRMLHFLVARDYLQPTDLMDAFALADESEAVRFSMRVLARKMGVGDDEPLPEIFERAAADPEAVGQTWDTFFAENEQLALLVDAWNNLPGNEEPYVLQDGKFMDQLADRAMPWDILFGRIGRGGYDVRISLEMPVEPYFTNGVPDDEETHLVWREALASPYIEDAELPGNVFAMWAEPDTEVQQRHFGTVLLEDEALGRYCVWYQALTDSRREEWDDFIASLAPGPGLRDAVRAFRFTDDPPGEASAAAVGKHEIQNQLRVRADAAQRAAERAPAEQGGSGRN